MGSKVLYNLFTLCDVVWSQHPYLWKVDVSVCKMGPYPSSILHDVASGMPCWNRSHIACHGTDFCPPVIRMLTFILFFPFFSTIFCCQHLWYTRRPIEATGTWLTRTSSRRRKNWTSRTWELYHRIQSRKTWNFEPTEHGLKGGTVHGFH